MATYSSPLLSFELFESPSSIETLSTSSDGSIAMCMLESVFVLRPRVSPSSLFFDVGLRIQSQSPRPDVPPALVPFMIPKKRTRKSSNETGPLQGQDTTGVDSSLWSSRPIDPDLSVAAAGWLESHWSNRIGRGSSSINSSSSSSNSSSSTSISSGGFSERHQRHHRTTPRLVVLLSDGTLLLLQFDDTSFGLCPLRTNAFDVDLELMRMALVASSSYPSSPPESPPARPAHVVCFACVCCDDGHGLILVSLGSSLGVCLRNHPAPANDYSSGALWIETYAVPLVPATDKIVKILALEKLKRVMLFCRSGRLILLDVHRLTAGNSTAHAASPTISASSSSSAAVGAAAAPWTLLSSCSSLASAVGAVEEPLVTVRGEHVFISRGNDCIECINISTWLNPDPSAIPLLVEMQSDTAPSAGHTRRISSLVCIDVWRRDTLQANSAAARNLIPPICDPGLVAADFVLCAGSHDGTVSYWQASRASSGAVSGASVPPGGGLWKVALEQFELSTPASDLLDGKDAVSGLTAYPLSGLLFKMVILKGLDSDSRMAQTIRGLQRNHSKLLTKISPFVSVEWAYRGDLTTERISDTVIQSLVDLKSGNAFSLFGFLVAFLQSVLSAVTIHFGSQETSASGEEAVHTSASSDTKKSGRGGKQSARARGAKARPRRGARSSRRAEGSSSSSSSSSGDEEYRYRDDDDDYEDDEGCVRPRKAASRSADDSSAMEVDDDIASLGQGKLAKRRKKEKKTKVLAAFPDDSTKIDRCLGNFIRSILLFSDCIGMTELSSRSTSSSVVELDRLRECLESVLRRSSLRDMQSANPISVSKFLIPSTDTIMDSSMRDLLTFPEDAVMLDSRLRLVQMLHGMLCAVDVVTTAVSSLRKEYGVRLLKTLRKFIRVHRYYSLIKSLLSMLVGSPPTMGHLTRQLFDILMLRCSEAREVRCLEGVSTLDLLSDREVLSLHRMMRYVTSAIHSTRNNIEEIDISMGPLLTASIKKDVASLSMYLPRVREGNSVHAMACPVCGDALVGLGEEVSEMAASSSNEGSDYIRNNGEEMVVCFSCLSPIELCCQSLLPVIVPGNEDETSASIETMVCGACLQYTNVNCGNNVGILDAHEICIFCCLPLYVP